MQPMIRLGLKTLLLGTAIVTFFLRAALLINMPGSSQTVFNAARAGIISYDLNWIHLIAITLIVIVSITRIKNIFIIIILTSLQIKLFCNFYTYSETNDVYYKKHFIIENFSIDMMIFFISFLSIIFSIPLLGRFLARLHKRMHPVFGGNAK